MSLRTTRTVALLAVGLAAAFAATAQGRTLTVDEAVELALERNLSLEAARLDHEAAKWGLRGAWASLFPRVSLSSTATRVDPDTYERANASLGFIEQMGIEVEPFLYETTYETGFRATVPIWNGGRLWGAVGAAGGARDAARHSYESARRSVVVDARSAYFDVLRTESLLAISQDAAEAARGNLATAQRRFDIGAVPRVELLRWRVTLADAERALAEAEGAVTLARTQFASVLGLPLDESFELVDLSRANLDGSLARLDGLLAGGELGEQRARELLSASPDFAALSDATRVSRAGVAIARGAFLPSINASGSYGWKSDDDIEPDDETAWSVTLAMEVPVFTSFQNLSDYKQSRREHLAAVKRQEDVERSLVAGLRNAVATLETRSRALAAAEELELQSHEHLKNVTSRYEQGMAPYTEFVDARILYDRSRLGSVNALYDCFLAVAEVERLVGEPGEEE